MDNYSKINGSMNKKLNCDGINIKKDNNGECHKCGAMIENEYLYCKNCGVNFHEKYYEKNGVSSLSKNKFDTIKEYLNFRESIKVSMIAIGLLLIISTICKFVLGFNNYEINELINPLHILLTMNLGSMKVYSSSMTKIGVGYMDFGLIILSILPVISIILANIIVYKNKIKSSEDLIRKSVGVAFCYGGVLGVIALISKVTLNYSYNMSSLGYIVQLKFNFIDIIIKGAIIGFISTYICLNRKSLKHENMYIEILKKAINMVFIGYVFVFIVVAIVTISDKNYLYGMGLSSFIGKIGLIATISQIALYMFGFGNLIPFIIGEREYSILKILNSNIGITTILLLISMICLITLIIFIFACKLEAKYKREKGIKPIILLSCFYSIIIGAMSIISTISLGEGINIMSMGNYSIYMSMGLGFVSSVLISFIYSFIVSLVGYKLNIFNDVVEESNE